MPRLLFIILIIIAAFGLFFVYPNYRRAKISGNVVQCGSRLRQIGDALEEYAKHHDGKYPASLSLLSPTYLKELPRCPAGRNTDYVYLHNSKPEVYTVLCQGNFHSPATMDNHPLYDSINGLDYR